MTPASMIAYGQPTHDFTLQTIMELQKSVGGLQVSVATLTKSIENQIAALDRTNDQVKAECHEINNKISGITHKIYAAGVVLGIAVIFGGWVVNKSWDLIATIAVPALQDTVKQSAIAGQAQQTGPSDPTPNK